jgi:hypothetical protein
MSIGTLLPLALVMVLGVQTVTAIFLVTSDNWVQNSLALLAGAAIPPVIIISAAYIILNGGTSSGGEKKWIYWIVFAGLAAAAIHVFLTRKTATLPKWMGKLEHASPRFAFKIGLLLFGLFPPDILTSIAVGSALAGHGDPLWHAVFFIALSVLLLGIPFFIRLLFRERAKVLLPKARDWMNSNSWIVNEFVLVFLMVLAIDSLAS